MTDVLEYEVAPQAPREPRRLYAFLFALPGVLCWALLLFISFGGTRLLTRAGVSAALHIYPLAALLLWGVAVLTALASLLYYRNKARTWYVFLCLMSNQVGLLLSAFALVIAVYIVS